MFSSNTFQNQLKDLFALTDVVISRAGANAICELLALHKPNLLIPLSANASRGDQILNARSFERQGFSIVLEEEELNKDTLLDSIHKLYQHRNTYIDAMKHSSQQDSINTIINLIQVSCPLNYWNKSANGVVTTPFAFSEPTDNLSVFIFVILSYPLSGSI